MTKKCCVLILVATIAALLLRLPRLSQRPMHGDEAVHAIKFGKLLEKNIYRYDPHEYHGPALNYLTLIPAWLSSADTLAKANECTLRIVPVCCGVLLVLFVMLIADGLGSNASVFAAILTAISPAMVFYSRYYIQEMLLVCFTFGIIVSGYRYSRTGKIIWIIMVGVFLGLMHASKETFIINLGSIALALAAGMILGRKKEPSEQNIRKIKISYLFAGLAAAVIISALFFSSFFTNPKGILDSVLTYKTYLNRAGDSDIHNHPWYYYLRILIFYRFKSGPVWTESLVVILAVIGFIASFIKKGISYADMSFLRFIGFYTLILTVIYSVMPYKTPWCALSFLHGMILLAGFGISVLIQLVYRKVPRMIVSVLLLGAAIHLAWLSYLNNYKYYADSRNPYVYAHPTNEIYAALEKIEFYAKAHPQGRNMYIEVIFPGHDYWPLPWYLRSFSSIAWRDKVDFKEPSASLIIASPSIETDLTKKLYDDSIPPEQRHMYMYLIEKDPYYIWLRPRVELYGFVRKDLWDIANAGPDPNEIINQQAEK
ncbi:MAG: TIGR03663 family protein [Sedimentisphaerales bacterium]|nr:TIGR03663 family protein [Sedimentisphaerales bacterium]